MIHDQDEGLVSPSDIADMAGVSRGAVSNWRKRAGDFPEPVAGTSAKPLFSRQQVTVWLESRGHQPKRDAGESGVWAALNLLRGQLSVDDAADLVLTLAAARLNGAAASPELPNIDPAIVARVNQAIDHVDVSALGTTVDFTLERLARSQGKIGADHGFVGSRTTKLLATLAAARPGGVLYDPACGIAAALLEAVSLGARPARVVGHDVSPRALNVASRRAELHGIAAEFALTDVLVEDIDPALRADTVILEPPFGVGFESASRLTDARFEFGAPPRMSADTAWLQHAIAHLEPSGRAYVLSPMATLSRGGDEARIRTELVRRGCVHAVVALPGKMLPHTPIPLALWVLGRPSESASVETVLFLDATESVNPERQVAGWLANPELLDEVAHARVATANVLAAGAVLSPQRWVYGGEPAPDEVTNAYVDGRQRIERSLESMRRNLDAFEHLANFSRSRLMTVGELIEQGVVELRPGRSTDRYADAPEPLKRRIAEARDVRDDSLRDESLEGEFPDFPELTRADDVLATTMTHVRARVDTVGGHIPGTGVYRLRILDANAMLPHYLALALTGSWNERFQRGSTIKKAPIRELEVPLLPIQEQQDLWGTSVFVTFLAADAKELARQVTRVEDALLNAVRYNAPLTGNLPVENETWGVSDGD